MTINPGDSIALGRTWTIGDPVGSGGFGKVLAATDGSADAVAKFVPKQPGADRELLFVDLGDTRNVVPVLDHGETEEHLVIVMPRATGSLRDEMAAAEDGLYDLAASVLSDVCVALSDLEGRIVHRDIKPENILRLGDSWCLADFGISRYAEASTAADTQKFAMTAQYAAPERWRSERATTGSDIYSLGVTAYEVLTGQLPFPGPTWEDLREQHLHREPAALTSAPKRLAALIEEMLYKAPDARPRPSNLASRLVKLAAAPSNAGLAALEGANLSQVQRNAEAARRASLGVSAHDRHQALRASARSSLKRIAQEVYDLLTDAAPTAEAVMTSGGAWRLTLGSAKLTFATERSYSGWFAGGVPPFEVVETASIDLTTPANQYGYQGRSHSLWFCDAHEAGDFGWFETAFMISPLMQQQTTQAPFLLDPGPDAQQAIGRGIGTRQVAWPFTRLDFDDLDDFVCRWAGWLAAASTGALMHPSQLPERDAQGSWRTS